LVNRLKCLLFGFKSTIINQKISNYGNKMIYESSRGPEQAPTSYEDMSNDLMAAGLTEPYTDKDVEDWEKGVDMLVDETGDKGEAPLEEQKGSGPVFQKPTQRLTPNDVDAMMNKDE
jgi:hypothetical protein